MTDITSFYQLYNKTLFLNKQQKLLIFILKK